MEKSKSQGVTMRYSNAFKLKVVSEIENGKLIIADAKRIYGIKGADTIQKWMRKLGKLHLLNKIVRVEMQDEVSRIKELEKQKKELESALAQAHLKILAYESLIEASEKKLGIDLKKNLEQKRLNISEEGKTTREQG